MIRDIDLIRDILLDIERRSYKDFGTPLRIAGRTDEELWYHAKLLAEAGLITGKFSETCSGVAAFPNRLTWQGHEFLDAAREPGRWKAAMKTIGEKPGAVGFEVLTQLLVAITKQSLSLP